MTTSTNIGYNVPLFISMEEVIMVDPDAYRMTEAEARKIERLHIYQLKAWQDMDDPDFRDNWAEWDEEA